MQFGDASAALDGDSQISAVVVLRVQDESTPTLEAACIAAPAARSQHHAPTSYTLSSRDQNTPDHDMVSKFLEICEWEKGVVAMVSSAVSLCSAMSGSDIACACASAPTKRMTSSGKAR
eukprot:3937658-Rhodomonas_salina.3